MMITRPFQLGSRVIAQSAPARYRPSALCRSNGGLATYCCKIDPGHPTSGLLAFMRQYAERGQARADVGLRFLRCPFWVN